MVVAESLEPGVVISAVARRHGLTPQQLFGWRHQMRSTLPSKPWLEKQLATVSGRSPIASAMRYGTSHWDGLVRYLDDGRIEIDTNTVERSIRPIALSRKNALFAGSDEGGANWAIIASLIETCKLNGVNPHAWLTDTLTKLVTRWPANRIDDLMPWAYAKIGNEPVKV